MDNRYYLEDLYLYGALTSAGALCLILPTVNREKILSGKRNGVTVPMSIGVGVVCHSFPKGNSHEPTVEV